MVQRLCLRIPQKAFCISELHARRLRDEGFRGELTVLRGLYDGPLELRDQAEPEPVVVFAGRFIPEKRVEALVPAVARARVMLPELRGELYGDGPERERVQRAATAAGLDGIVRLPGFVSSEEIEHALSKALCLTLPSRREGFGLVVVEAASYGTPSVVVAGEDNAAVELVEEGVNGFVAASAAAEDIAAAILRVHDGGAALRGTTAQWFEANAPRLSIARSLEIVGDAYGTAKVRS
jgi:glycosyltransferase involved in cell wall biosynthesis